jgi:NAD(P)-dependent dehydrogenase (short-subunit alcohol dehydrogenase family)
VADRQIALVTGASSGIGLETAALLAARGYRTYGTSRAPGEHSAPKDVTMLKLDVRSDEAAREVVDEVQRKEGRIDVLVNNAGYGLFGAIEEIRATEAREQLETNFWGAVRMIAQVLPGMRERRSGKIINISSVLGFLPAPFQGFYVASKHALEGYSEVLSIEVQQFGIHVVLVEPSSIATRFFENHKDATAHLPDYRTERDRVLAMMRERLHRGSHPKKVARVVLRAVRSKAPDVRYTAGAGSGFLKVARTVLPTTLFDRAVRKTFAMGQ